MERKDLGLHDVGKNIMVKIFKEAFKSPIRWQRLQNVKATVVRDDEVVIKIINEICNHRKAFAFHNNKGADHGMVRKSLTPGTRVFLNKR